MVDGSITIGTKINQKGFKKGVSNIENGICKIRNSLKGFASAVGIAFGVTAVVRFGKATVTAANDFTNALTGLKSVMDGQGRSFSQAQGFINSYVKDGLIPATDAITAYKNLALRGYDDSQIQQVMTALKDSSAFGRQASYTMGEAVKTATEGLKNENSILVDNAGVTKNVAKMWEDYATSIGTTTKNLTQQQKIQAEVNGILEESKYQSGDAAKVANSFSGQLQQLKFRFNDLKIAIGNALIPIAQVVMPSINMMITGLTKLANTFAQVSAAIFGKRVTQTDEMATNSQAAADGQEKLASSIKSASKAAKGAIAPFDELNVLQSGKVENGGVDTTIPNEPQLPAPTIPSIETPIVSESVMATLDVLKEKLQPVITSVQDLGLSLEPIRTFAAQGMIDFYNLFLVPVGDWAMGEAFPHLVNTLKDGLATINWANLNKALSNLWTKLTPFAQKVGEGLLWFWDNVMVPFGGWVMNDAAPIFLDLLAAALDALIVIIEALEPLALWLWDNFLDPLAEFTGGIIISIIKGLTEAFKKFSDWARNNKEIVQTITVIILTFLAEVWLYKTVKNISQFITGTLVPAFVSFGKKLALMNTPLLVAGLGLAVLTAGIIALAMNWDKMSPAQRVITIFGALAAAAIAAAIAIAVFHTSWTAGLAAAGIVAGLALLAGSYYFSGKNVSLDGEGGSIEDAYAFADTVKSDSPLPKLARGGIVDGPTVAMVGERGKEAVMPLENNTGWMDVLVDKIAGRVATAVSSTGGDVVIPIYLDGGLIDEYIVSARERMSRRSNGRV